MSPGSVSNTEIDLGGLSIEIALYEISRSLGLGMVLPACHSL